MKIATPHSDKELEDADRLPKTRFHTGLQKKEPANLFKQVPVAQTLKGKMRRAMYDKGINLLKQREEKNAAEQHSYTFKPVLSEFKEPTMIFTLNSKEQVSWVHSDGIFKLEEEEEDYVKAIKIIFSKNRIMLKKLFLYLISLKAKRMSENTKMNIASISSFLRQVGLSALITMDECKIFVSRLKNWSVDEQGELFSLNFEEFKLFILHALDLAIRKAPEFAPNIPRALEQLIVRSKVVYSRVIPHSEPGDQEVIQDLQLNSVEPLPLVAGHLS